MGNQNGGGGLLGNQAGCSQYWFQVLCVENLLSVRLHMNSRWPKQDDLSNSLFTLDEQIVRRLAVQTICRSSSVKTAIL